MSKAQQPNTHTKDNKADQDKRIVPQTHVVIDPSLPTSASQPEPAKSDPQSPDKPLPRFERPEWVIVYITAAYSIVSLLTLFVIKRQTTLMAEQSKFAISKERARISVEIVTQPEEIDDPFWDIRFKVCNIGPTHAFEVKMTIGSTENDKSSCLFAAPVEKIAIAPTLKSGEERETRYWPPLQDYVAASEGKTVVYLLGSLEFEDVFGKQRVTIFTYRWRVGGLEKVKQPSRWEYVGERENLHA